MRRSIPNGHKFERHRALLAGALLVVFFSITAGGTGYPSGQFLPAGEGERPAENGVARGSPAFALYISYLMAEIDASQEPGVICRISDEGMRMIRRFRGLVEKPVDDGNLLKLPSPARPFASTYQPGSLMFLADPAIPSTKQVEVAAVAFEPLREMVAFVNSHPGCQLMVASGYRSYERQAVLFANRAKRVLIEYPELQGDREKAERIAGRIVAVPGTSQHMTGRAIDFTTAVLKGGLVEEFAGTPEGRLLKEHAWRYGFVFPYAEGKEEITGYIYEPWHLLYVGKYHAEIIQMHGWVIEEYLGYMEKERSILFRATDGELRRYLYNEETGTVEVNLIKEKEPSWCYLRGRWNWEEKWSKRGEVVDRPRGLW